jgi:TIR domain
MTSLAELPELVGFFSYSRKDDEHSEGSLSRLRARIYNELRLQLGRDFRLWQDTAAIPNGALWEDEIRRAIAESAFFIPIVTPSAIASEHCRFEFESFLKREAELGRTDLVFPILYIRVPALEDEAQWRKHDLLKIIGSRQYIDWQRFRFRDAGSPDVAEKVESFCKNIFEALHRSWLSPEERRAKSAAAEAERQAEKLRNAEREAQQSAEPERKRLDHVIPELTKTAEPAPKSVPGLNSDAANNGGATGAEGKDAVPFPIPAGTDQRVLIAPHGWKQELVTALMGIVVGAFAGLVAAVIVAALYQATGLALISRADREVQGVILFAPVLIVSIVVAARWRYNGFLGMPAWLAYALVGCVALLFASWCGFSYVELLMAQPVRSINTPGFFFGYAAAAIMLTSLLYFRLRSRAGKIG